MEHAKQVELIHRVLEHLRSGTTHLVEEESRLPVAPYLQPGDLREDLDAYLEGRALSESRGS